MASFELVNIVVFMKLLPITLTNKSFNHVQALYDRFVNLHQSYGVFQLKRNTVAIGNPIDE